MKKYDVVRIQSIEGRDKPAYTNCGIMLIKDDGKISLKLNSIPIGNWDGWLSIFPKKEREAPPEVPQEQTNADPF